MVRRFTRRDFVRTSAAAGLAAAAPRGLAQKAPAVSTGSVKPVVISSANGNWFKNGGSVTCVEKAWTLMTAGLRRARRADRRRQHRRARSRGLQRRLRRRPELRGRRPTRLLVHARAAQAGRRRRGPRGRAHAVARGPRGDEQDRPSPPGRPWRAVVRAQHGLHDRGGPEHAALAQALARVEAADRSLALPDAEGARDRLQRRPQGHGARGSFRRVADVRDDQLRRRQRQGRDLRRDDDLRPLLQDPRPRRRFADPGRRALRGRRGRRGRARRAAARRTCTTSRPSTSWTACAAACTPRTPAWRR